MFEQDILQQLWNKSRELEGMDPRLFRKDPCGAIIAWEQYEQQTSPFGWGVDHIYPVEKGGDDNIENLRVMHCLNLKAKGNDYPVYESAVTMDIVDNKPYVSQFRVKEEIQKKLSLLYPESIL